MSEVESKYRWVKVLPSGQFRAGFYVRDFFIHLGDYVEEDTAAAAADNFFYWAADKRFVWRTFPFNFPFLYEKGAVIPGPSGWTRLAFFQWPKIQGQVNDNELTLL